MQSLVLQTVRIMLLQAMNIEQQESVKLQPEFTDKKQPSAATVRNRRFKKLNQLREEGFFSQDAIKLRHPLLYHNYLGRHSQKTTGQANVNCTLSQFLEKNLINLEYRQRLAKELDNAMHNQAAMDNQAEDENWQVLSEMTGEMTIDRQGIQGREAMEQQAAKNKYKEGAKDKNKKKEERRDKDKGKGSETRKGHPKERKIVEEQQIELQEQNLIDHAQQLFMNGKISSEYINYWEIDNCSDYDWMEAEDRDAEQRYFCAMDEMDEEGAREKEQDKRINLENYTGILDY